MLTLPLAGCSPSISEYQQVLDAYASNAQSMELGQWLEGAALHEATQSQELLLSLGWQQVGSSRFSETRLVASNRALSCLDVSDVSFIDAAGEPVEISRQTPRLLMEIEFSEGLPLRLQQLEQVGSC